MVFNYSIVNSMILSFLKLVQSCSSDKFAFLSLYSQICVKFVSDSLQILFNFTSKPAFFLRLSIHLRKLFTPFSFTVWKMFVFGVVLVCIFAHLDWIGIFHISQYSVQMRENTDQNNSEYRHFLHSVYFRFALIALSLT